MTLVVKICGLRTAEAVTAAVAAGADMIGFVFFEKSPRHVTLHDAAALAALVPPAMRKVALTVDPDDARLAAIAAAFAPDLVQLHGRETPQRAADIRRRFGVPVMKALGVGARDDLAAAAQWGNVDHLLIDAKPPPDAAYPGGHGRRFDWSILDDRHPALRFMLSGGLDAENVADAVARVRPWGSTSSGVETGRIKDPAKIAAFVAAARAAERDAR